ncbi:MAG: hypothetical protein MK132_08130 [Lentisphaerales bacterium]|nr:hypothetical protein [Lentisphaerales bacterium]
MSNAFSKKWMWFSFAIFIVLEICVGAVLGEIIAGTYKSHNMRFMLQGLLHVGSFFLGGLIIGFISPGIRLVEPAVAAALAILVISLLTFFTPYRFFHFSLGKLIIAGTIAFFLALKGAQIGERLSGNKT